jgi:hypothetical protein
LSEWVSWGQCADRFWHLTLRHQSVIMRGAARGLKREFRQSESVAYALAKLVMIGFQNPKNFPEFDKVFPGRGKARRKTPMSPEQMTAQITAYVIASGGKVVKRDG